MESVDVCESLFIEEVEVDELTAVGSDGQVLPAVEGLVHMRLGASLTHHDVLDADSEFTLPVESWFVGDTHAFQKSGLVSGADAVRTFMHVQVASNTVASAVFIV